MSSNRQIQRANTTWVGVIRHGDDADRNVVDEWNMSVYEENVSFVNGQLRPR